MILRIRWPFLTGQRFHDKGVLKTPPGVKACSHFPRPFKENVYRIERERRYREHGRKALVRLKHPKGFSSGEAFNIGSIVDNTSVQH
jgi:hypothetical protein